MTRLLICCFIVLALSCTAALALDVPNPQAIILGDPVRDNQLATAMVATLNNAGYQVSIVSAADVAKPQLLTQSACSLLVLPHANALPPGVIPTLQSYLKSGGHLIALGLPATGDKLAPLETLSPAYKFFPIHGTVRLTIPDDQLIAAASSAMIDVPQNLKSSYPRTSGAGFAKNRPWRWVSLLQAQDAKSGQWRGSPGTLLIYPPGKEYAGGIWAAFAPTDDKFYLQPSIQTAIGQIATHMRDGLFLIEGGAEFYSYFPNQPVRLGAVAANLAQQDAVTTCQLSVTVTLSDGTPLAAQTWPVAFHHGQSISKEFTWTSPESWPADGYTVTTELAANGHVIDRLQHQIYCSPPPAQKDWIISRDGHFYLDGNLWRANGVNYMPSSGMALENHDIYENWLSAAAYDPEVIERDLAHIEDIGFNAVSVFIYGDEVSAQNLLDFLRCCRLHHQRVHLSLRPGVGSELIAHDRNDAEAHCWQAFKSIIEHYHLADDDTIFAYEIDWEPRFDVYGRQKRTDGDWEKWINTRYGKLSTAEKSWGTPVPRTKTSAITGPAIEQLHNPAGPEIKMIAAYRHFLDDWLADTYGQPARQIRSIAPHQYVTFRMQGASDPDWDSNGPNYQIEGLARVLDILEPESYSQLQKPGGGNLVLFRMAYFRSVAPNKPLIWAETGMSIWDDKQQCIDPKLASFEGQYYLSFYHLAKRGGADGIFWWWFPGGYRTNEKSDFGLLNPDGTDRNATTAIRRESAAFLAAPLPHEPDVWLEYDRDAHPDGTLGIYRELKQKFGDAVAQWKVVGLKAKPTLPD